MPLFCLELKKLLLLLRRDPKSMAAGMIAPSMVLIIFILLFGGLKPMPVSFINRDTGAWGARFMECILGEISPLGEIPYFENIPLPAGEAFTRFGNGELAGVIVIPEDFSTRLEAGTEPRLEYHLLNYSSDFAKNMRLYFAEGKFAFYKKYYPGVKINVSEHFSRTVKAEWVDIIATGTFLLAFIIGGAFTYLYIFFKEKLYSTLILYRTSPVSPLPSLLARYLFSLCISTLAGMLNGLLVYLLLGINLFSLLPALLGPLLMTVTVYICLVAIAALFIDNFFSAVMGTMGSIMLLWFFSGGFTSIEPAGSLMLLIFRLIPNSYALDLIRGVVFDYQHHSRLFDYTGLGIFLLFFGGIGLLTVPGRLAGKIRPGRDTGKAQGAAA